MRWRSQRIIARRSFSGSRAISSWSACNVSSGPDGPDTELAAAICPARLSHCPPPGGGGIGPDRHAVGHPIEPGPQRDAAADRTRFLDEDQERGLEGILGVVRILQDAPADAQDHRPVTRHQDLERRGVIPGGEALEQLRSRRVP